MSKITGSLETLIVNLKSLGCDEGDSTILYHLFDGDDVDELFYNVEGFASDWKERRQKADEFLSRNGYEHIESDGGSEGGGEYCYGVIKVGNTYYKAEWSYYSYNGCEFDYIESTVKEVTPKEKTITVYE